MPNLPMPDGLGIPDLECVMLDVEPLNILASYGMDVNKDDLFYGDIPELKYAQGAVGAESAHVTLLFGIHPSETYFEDVMNALEGWAPDDLMVREVGFFPSTTEGQDYKSIVAHIIPSANLLVARKRLEKLNFTSKFPEYNPHVTLAYIKGTADEKEWVRRLNVTYSRRVLTPLRLNLGLEDDK